MANKRLFYAVYQVGIYPDGTAAGINDFSNTGPNVHGLQSCGMTTRFALDQIFEIGQLDIYDQVENVPEVELTLEKVLDGKALLYHLATINRGATEGPDLAARSNARCLVAVSYFPDTQSAASGDSLNEVVLSGMFCSAANYTFPTEGNCTEAVTLVGNNKVWAIGAGSTVFEGYHTNADSPVSSIQRRQNVQFGEGHAHVCRLPHGLSGGIPGVTTSGTVALVGGEFSAHIQSLKTTCDLGRENMFELGRKAPYFRYVNFPVEVKCDIEVYNVSGDYVDCSESTDNLVFQPIFISTQDGTYVDLGKKNKLTSVTETGGNAGTGGGNRTSTYSYSNWNYLIVTHTGAFPHATDNDHSGWWITYTG